MVTQGVKWITLDEALKHFPEVPVSLEVITTRGNINLAPPTSPASKARGLCWVWNGRLDKDGYARAYYNKRDERVHRVMYEMLVGPIRKGKFLDHLCRNRVCVNPEHLEPVTSKVNTRRGAKDRKKERLAAST